MQWKQNIFLWFRYHRLPDCANLLTAIEDLSTAFSRNCGIKLERPQHGQSAAPWMAGHEFALLRQNETVHVTEAKPLGRKRLFSASLRE
jgi:hypothetical protein